MPILSKEDFERFVNICENPPEPTEDLKALLRGYRISGTSLIEAERQRQISKENWTANHDDEHTDGSLIQAARAYTWAAFCEVTLEAKAKDFKYVPNDWPPGWRTDYWKPSDDPIRNLVKAGALIAAEIDRLQRAKKGTE